MKFEPCINCGRRGFYETKNVFIEGKTHKCKYCEMEFEKKLNKGELAWVGDIPKFV